MVVDRFVVVTAVLVVMMAVVGLMMMVLVVVMMYSRRRDARVRAGTSGEHERDHHCEREHDRGRAQ
jgi:uncharacterized membrane protein